MPYRQRVIASNAFSPSEQQDLIIEFDALRQELDEMRAAYMSLRALLVAGTALGAGYNTTATDLGTTTANTAVPPRRFTAI